MHVNDIRCNAKIFLNHIFLFIVYLFIHIFIVYSLIYIFLSKPCQLFAYLHIHNLVYYHAYRNFQNDNNF